MKFKFYYTPFFRNFQSCFSCHACTRPLDSMLACDAPDNDIYCKGCYSKKFGAHGYGFGCGAAFLQTADM